MNVRAVMAALFILVLLAACGSPATQPANNSTGKALVTVYKSPT